MAAIHLGEFEQLLLLTIAAARPGGVRRRHRGRAGAARRAAGVARGVYATLDRLEDKGLVRSKTGAGTPARDGIPRRAYSVTPSGVIALRASRKVLQRLWQGLDQLKEPSA